MANGMTWRPPTAEEEALQAPAWYADPINFIQPTGSMVRSAGLGLGKQTTRMAANLAMPEIETGIAAAVPRTSAFTREQVASVLPSEVRDLARIAGWVGQKLGIGGKGIASRAAEVGARQPITTVTAAANIGPATGRGGENRPPAPSPPPSKTEEAKQASGGAVDINAIRQQFNDDPYAYLSYMAQNEPQRFMDFINANGGHPAMEGVSYRLGGTRDDGSREIIPVFNSKGRSAGRGVGRGEEGGGMDFGRDLTFGELKILAPIIAARMARGEANDLRRQHLDQLRIANEMALQEKREGRKDTLAQREEENFDKNVVNVYGKTAMGDINPAKGLFLAAVHGEKIPAARQNAAQRLASPYLTHIQNLEKKYGRAIPEAQKKTILENYMKATFGE